MVQERFLPYVPVEALEMKPGEPKVEDAAVGQIDLSGFTPYVDAKLEAAEARLREADTLRIRDAHQAEVLRNRALNSEVESVRNEIGGAYTALFDPVPRFSGTVLRTEGDAVIAYYGSPDDAAAAALEQHAAAESLPEVDSGGSKHKFAVRTSISFGPLLKAVVGTKKHAYIAVGPAMTGSYVLSKAAAKGDIISDAGVDPAKFDFERLDSGMFRILSGAAAPESRIARRGLGMIRDAKKMQVACVDKDYLMSFVPEELVATAGEPPTVRSLTTVFGRMHGLDRLADAAIAAGNKADIAALVELYSGIYDMLWERLGDFGGAINRFTGNAYRAIFGHAKKDMAEASRAFGAAWSIRQGIEELCKKYARLFEAYGIDDSDTQAAGISRGKVFLGHVGDQSRMEYAMFGSSVITAARLMQRLGGPYASMPEELAKDIDLKGYEVEREVVQLKGKKEPMKIATVTGKKIRGIGGKGQETMIFQEERLVGRKAETDAIEEWLEAAAGSGPKVLGFVGDEGSGKTALGKYAERRLARRGARLLSGEGYSYKRVPFLPYRQALTPLFTDEALAALGDVPRAYVNRMLGKESGLGNVAAGELVDGVGKAVAEKLNGEGTPVLLMLRDYHWFDDESVSLTDYLIRKLENPNVHIVAELRPDRSFPYEGVGKVLHLEGLSDEAAEALIDRMSSRRASPSVKEFVIGKSNGRPLHIREWVTYLKEKGMLEGAVGNMSLPPKLEDATLSRLDSLPGPVQKVVKYASVAGMKWAPEVVALMLGEDAQHLAPALEELTVRGLIERDTLRGKAARAFHHVWYRDVPYNNLPPSERAELHGKAGKAVRAAFDKEYRTEWDIDVVSEVSGHFDKSSWESSDEGVAERNGSLNSLAIAYSIRGYYPQARQSVQRVDFSRAADAETRRKLDFRARDITSDLLFREEKHEEAYQKYLELLGLAASNAERLSVYWSLGRICCRGPPYYGLLKPTEALKYFEEVSRILHRVIADEKDDARRNLYEGKRPVLLYERSEALHTAGLLDELNAGFLFAQALQCYADGGKDAHGLTKFLYDLGQGRLSVTLRKPQIAISHAEHALDAAAPEYEANAHLIQGLAYRQLGDEAGARKALEKTYEMSAGYRSVRRAAEEALNDGRIDRFIVPGTVA
jgi:class 3 adenylate cyclase/tetratricopeptide (TPR) repeat protein